MSDLPTSEPVPWNMSASAGIFLELDTGLRLHAGGEVMFHQRHLGDEGGSCNHFRFGIAAGDDDMQSLPARRERGDNAAQIEMLVTQRNVELVENHHRNIGSGH